MIRKLLLLAAAALLPAVASAQVVIGPNFAYKWTVINTTTTGQVGNAIAFTGTRGPIPVFYTLQWVVSGTTPSACTFGLQASNNGSTWFNVDAGGISCTGSSVEYILQKPVSYLRVNLATWTPGDATSVVTFNYVGSAANGGPNGAITPASVTSTFGLEGTGTVSVMICGAGCGTGASLTGCWLAICDSIRGQILFAEGTAPPTTGTLMTIGLGVTRAQIPTCIVQLDGVNGTAIPLSTNGSTTSQLIVGLEGVALTASTSYYLKWICIGI